MKTDRVLVTVSAAQLASGLCGLALALRRRHAFDIPFWRGQESTVGRDSLLMGTALSAPVVMLGAQAGAIAALLRRPDPAAERLLGGLGATMVAGYRPVHDPLPRTTTALASQFVSRGQTGLPADSIICLNNIVAQQRHSGWPVKLPKIPGHHRLGH